MSLSYPRDGLLHPKCTSDRYQSEMQRKWTNDSTGKRAKWSNNNQTPSPPRGPGRDSFIPTTHSRGSQFPDSAVGFFQLTTLIFPIKMEFEILNYSFRFYQKSIQILAGIESPGHFWLPPVGSCRIESSNLPISKPESVWRNRDQSEKSHKTVSNQQRAV